MEINITVIDRDGQEHPLQAPTDMAMNLMEICKAYELPVEGTCGGMAMCVFLPVLCAEPTPTPGKISR